MVMNCDELLLPARRRFDDGVADRSRPERLRQRDQRFFGVRLDAAGLLVRVPDGLAVTLPRAFCAT